MSRMKRIRFIRLIAVPIFSGACPENQAGRRTGIDSMHSLHRTFELLAQQSNSEEEQCKECEVSTPRREDSMVQ